MLTSSQHKTVADLFDSDLSLGKQINFWVTSNSMKPLIERGDSVTVQVIKANEVKQGDIIVVRRSNDFLTHRAIKPHENGWITKGDANSAVDPAVKGSEIIGRIMEVHKKEQSISLDDHKWELINPILANLGSMEHWAFSHHCFIRIPFRVLIKSLLFLSMIK